MTPNDPRPEVSTLELVKETVEEARQLIKTEIALARNEAEEQLAAAKRIAIVMGAAVAASILGLAMLLVSLVLAIAPRPLTALITGVLLLMIASVAGLIGYGWLPKKPLEQTQERLQEDAHILKERLA